MSTDTVPGADPKNHDKLARGCWAEHEDGSLIFVKDIDENDRVVFEMYDFKNANHPVYYSHALSLKDFEKTFSYDKKKVGKLNLKWTWHDKTVFPWDLVMKKVSTPVPVFANVEDTLSAAARVAKSLSDKVKIQTLDEDHILAEQGLSKGPIGKTSKTIFGRLKSAIDKLKK